MFDTIVDRKDKHHYLALCLNGLLTEETWTEDNIKLCLKDALTQGFESALGNRGISASRNFLLVRGWMWVLQDTELAQREETEVSKDYGMNYFKCVSEKYNFPIPLAAGIPHSAHPDECGCS